MPTDPLPDILRPDDDGRPRGAARVHAAVNDADAALDQFRGTYLDAVAEVDGDDGLNDQGRSFRRTELRDEFFVARQELAELKAEKLSAIRAATNTAVVSGVDVATRRTLIADAARFSDADEARRAAKLHLATGDTVAARMIALAASDRTGDDWSSLATELVHTDPILSAAATVLDAATSAEGTRTGVAMLIDNNRWSGDPAASPSGELGARGVDNMSSF